MEHLDNRFNSPIRALMLLPRYILMLAVFIFVGEVSYMLYYDTTQLMAGRHIMLFNGGALIRGLVLVLPAAVIASGAMLGVHRVRHSGGGLLSIIAYIVLGAVTWLVVFPVVVRALEGIKYDVNVPQVQSISGGYFRDYGRDTVYFPHDFETEKAAAVFICGYENADDMLAMKIIDRDQMKKDAAPFSDILVKNTVPTVAKWITDGFMLFNKRAANALRRGATAWLSFAALGAVLFASYALSFCSRWRLMSVVIMLSMYTGCLSFNALYFTSMFKSLRYLSMSLPFGGGSDEVLLMCINLCLAVLFVLLGSLSAISRAREGA